MSRLLHSGPGSGRTLPGFAFVSAMIDKILKFSYVLSAPYILFDGAVS